MSRAIVDNGVCFFRDLSAAERRVLLVDYDGTLAPFTPNRHKATLYPGVRDLMRRIMGSCKTRLIVISGRAAYEVAALLELKPAPEIWGAHGVERIQPDGRRDEIAVNEDALQALIHAEARLESAGLGRHIEVKLAGVAVHWRGLSPAEILQIRTKTHRILEALARQPDLVMAEFEEGVELRLSSANKGNAMRTLLAELDPDVPVAYLGDDTTDEEAFRALNGRGLSVLVRPKHRFTAAKEWLKPPEELVGFFSRWIHACGAGR